MAKLVELDSNKTYATKANAIKAVEKSNFNNRDDLRYFITQNNEGRFYPVFIGQSALTNMVHFSFSVVM